MEIATDNRWGFGLAYINNSDIFWEQKVDLALNLKLGPYISNLSATTQKVSRFLARSNMDDIFFVLTYVLWAFYITGSEMLHVPYKNVNVRSFLSSSFCSKRLKGIVCQKKI